MDKYVTKSKTVSLDKVKMIRDEMVFSLTDARMKERLLRETRLKLVKALHICRAAEAAKQSYHGNADRTNGFRSGNSSDYKVKKILWKNEL